MSATREMPMTTALRRCVLAAVGVAVLAGCATVPTGPAINALPGSRKTAEQYYADDAACRAGAQSQFGPHAAQPANDAAAANVVGGTALGAAIGALIGAAFGDAGRGAAIGAGTGLIGGSAAAANVSGYSSRDMQMLYDREYLRCMYARGHQVPGRAVGYRPAPLAYGYLPPACTPPPAGTPMPRGYAPPTTSEPPGGFPPENTPPPPGTPPRG
jgi:uncharacterized protein YcfJ